MFFINAVTYLNIQENSYTVADFENISDPVQKAMDKTELHGSILFIKKKGKEFLKIYFFSVNGTG